MLNERKMFYKVLGNLEYLHNNCRGTNYMDYLACKLPCYINYSKGIQCVLEKNRTLKNVDTIDINIILQFE